MPEDPRTIITPSALSVAPELLGYALAPPMRRFAAILIDLGLAAIIARTGIEFLLAAAAALLAWRAFAGPADRLLAGRGRLVFRTASALLALIIVLNIWRVGTELLRDFGTDQAQATSAGPPTPPVLSAPATDATPDDADVAEDVEIALDEFDFSAGEKAAFLVRLAGLQMADGEAVSERAADLGRWVLDHTAEGTERSGLSAALAAMMVAEPTARAAFLRALGQDTTVGQEALDPLEQLGAENQMLAETNERLRAEMRELRDREAGGVRGFLGRMSNDLGLGFGWFALYFTAFNVLGRGQTPGKRLLRIRILRLDNRPLSWWLAFERFGGYAASFSTGLLGFAQILWDRNRQGLHDKAVGTVVITLRNAEPFRLT